MKQQNVSSTTDLKVFQMETQVWHAALEKLQQVLQQETHSSVFWGTVLINNGYLLAFNWFLHHLKFDTACSFSADIFFP